MSVTTITDGYYAVSGSQATLLVVLYLCYSHHCKCCGISLETSKSTRNSRCVASRTSCRFRGFQWDDCNMYSDDYNRGIEPRAADGCAELTGAHNSSQWLTRLYSEPVADGLVYNGAQWLTEMHSGRRPCTMAHSG